MHQAHTCHAQAPGDHDGRNENARTQAFEQDVGQGFGEGIGDEEDRQGSVIIPRCHVQVGQQAFQLGVADIGPVQEADEIEETQPGDQLEIEPPDELPVLRCVSEGRGR